MITVDNEYSLYFDGKEQTNLQNNNKWEKTDSLNLPGNTRVIAVMASNWLDDGNVGPAGILASTKDGFILTNSTWKCSNTSNDSWTNVGFDDSSWQQAVEIGPKGYKTWVHGQISAIDENAKWIWYGTEHVKETIYCRRNLFENIPNGTI